jgi:lipid-binding SYLF domain-containing protein
MIRYLTLVFATATFMMLAPAYAASSESIDHAAQAALEDLYVSSPGAKALGAKAKAILVFPDVHKAGFIIGAQSGDGVLIEGGKTTGRYRVDGLLAGLEAGVQTFSYSLFFMTDEALQRVLHTDAGWQIGADPNLVVVNTGAATDISTSTARVDIYSYVSNQKGLMGGISLEGLKITQVER